MQASNYPGVHDAEIVGVSVDRLSSSARLDMRRQDGGLCSVELHGLKAFRGEDLTLQNVVSRVLLSSAGQFSDEALEHWLTWVTSLSDATSWLSAERKHEWRKACEAGQLVAVVVEPSSGAQVVAVCERVVLA